MQLVAFILALAWPLAKKILVSLGIGALTYAGLTLIGHQIEAQVVAQWGQVGGDQLRMASMLGMPQALGILLGGLSARIALVAVGKIGKVTS